MKQMPRLSRRKKAELWPDLCPLSDTLPGDPCRGLGGKHSTYKIRPLPWLLQLGRDDLRRKYGRGHDAQKGRKATTSRFIRPCLRRFFLARGNPKYLQQTWTPEPIGSILPTPRKFYTVVQGNGLPFASFTDAMEAFCYAESLHSYAQDKKVQVLQIDKVEQTP